MKRINDPVHGTIGITAAERDVISSAAFQRLHNIKQLGLGSLVYPSANYSRFSHSVGTCHIIGGMLTAIKRNAGLRLKPAECQLYRLAALLHDIGHFPFSHTFEQAIRDFYAVEALTTAEGNADPPEGDVVFNHETVGREILKADASLHAAFKENGIDPEATIGILAGEDPEATANGSVLVHSPLPSLPSVSIVLSPSSSSINEPRNMQLDFLSRLNTVKQPTASAPVS